MTQAELDRKVCAFVATIATLGVAQAGAMYEAITSCEGESGYDAIRSAAHVCGYVETSGPEHRVTDRGRAYIEARGILIIHL